MVNCDDHPIGGTGLARPPLSTRAHQVHVLSNGRQRSFAIVFASDRKTSSGTLTW
jgi:hypothetical protein